MQQPVYKNSWYSCQGYFFIFNLCHHDIKHGLKNYDINDLHVLLRLLHTVHSNTPTCRKSIHRQVEVLEIFGHRAVLFLQMCTHKVNVHRQQTNMRIISQFRFFLCSPCTPHAILILNKDNRRRYNLRKKHHNRELLPKKHSFNINFIVRLLYNYFHTLTQNLKSSISPSYFTVFSCSLTTCFI